MAVISSNPNATSGKERTGLINLKYPIGEVTPISTVLRFVQYERFVQDTSKKENVTAILTLPMPFNIPENYGMQISDMQMGAAGLINQQNVNSMKNGNAGDMVQEIMKKGASVYNEVISGGGSTVAAGMLAASTLTGNSDYANMASIFMGRVQNPHTALMFQGVNLRQIYLEWRFAPKSEDESRAVKQILDTIKQRAHPAEVLGGYALDYPDLVYVEFTGKVAEYLPKFQKAFISNINITPDSSGGMNFFKSGAPTSYTLQLTLMEISILTRNKLIGDEGATQ